MWRIKIFRKRHLVQRRLPQLLLDCISHDFSGAGQLHLACLGLHYDHRASLVFTAHQPILLFTTCTTSCAGVRKALGIQHDRPFYNPTNATNAAAGTVCLIQAIQLLVDAP